MKSKISLFFTGILLGCIAICQTPVELADAQLEAYNKRDIDAFLIPYSDTVKVYNGSRELLYQGKETMREQYGAMFDRTPDLNCTLLNRIAVGNTVVEHEEVIFGAGRKVYAIVMYKVGFGKIQEVHFIGRK